MAVLPLERPVVSGLAEILYRRLRPLFAPEPEGWLGLVLCEALIGQLSELGTPGAGLARDTDANTGWATLLDPRVCPEWALPWLAMIAGVAIPPTITTAQLRDRLMSTDGQLVGRPAGIRGAPYPYLTGHRRVNLTERYRTRRGLLVTTYQQETPDAGIVQAALAEQKPAGFTIYYQALPGWTIRQMEAAYAGRSIRDLEEDFATIRDLETHLPDPD